MVFILVDGVMMSPVEHLPVKNLGSRFSVKAQDEKSRILQTMWNVMWANEFAPTTYPMYWVEETSISGISTLCIR